MILWFCDLTKLPRRAVLQRHSMPNFNKICSFWENPLTVAWPTGEANSAWTLESVLLCPKMAFSLDCCSCLCLQCSGICILAWNFPHLILAQEIFVLFYFILFYWKMINSFLLRKWLRGLFHAQITPTQLGFITSDLASAECSPERGMHFFCLVWRNFISE